MTTYDHLSAEVPLSARSPVDAIDEGGEEAAPTSSPRETAPDPVGQYGRSRLWNRRQVEAWAKKWRADKPWR
jgi:hypothetical protein